MRVNEGVNGGHAGASCEGRAEPGGGSGGAIPAPTPYARTYRLGRATVVELAGEIDLGSAHGIHPHLDAAVLGQPPLFVVFDLGPLEFIDCYGLALLLRTRRRVLDRGGRSAMVCTHPPTRRLLAMTGLDRVFRPVPTLEEALRS